MDSTAITLIIVFIPISFLLFAPLGMYIQEKLGDTPEEVAKSYEKGYKEGYKNGLKSGYSIGVDSLVTEAMFSNKQFLLNTISIEELKHLGNELQALNDTKVSESRAEIDEKRVEASKAMGFLK